MRSNQVKLSVIIPAFNESRNLRFGVLDQVDGYLKKQNYQYEVVIVDDGSTDDTVGILKQQIKDKWGFRLIENPHGGKAITVMTGLLESKGKIAVFTDMDQATPINQIENLFPKFDEGYDIVIGRRSGRKGAPLMRNLMSVGFAILRNIILGIPFPDTQCGFKAFNRSAIQIIFPQMLKKWKNLKVSGVAVNAGFDVEMLFLAKKRNLKITDAFIEWHYVGSERVPVLKSSIEAIKDMVNIRLNSLLGKYD